jgi:hypothetical protein
MLWARPQVWPSLTKHLTSDTSLHLIFWSVGLPCYSWPSALQYPQNKLQIPWKSWIGNWEFLLQMYWICNFKWKAIGVISVLDLSAYLRLRLSLWENFPIFSSNVLHIFGVAYSWVPIFLPQQKVLQDGCHRPKGHRPKGGPPAFGLADHNTRLSSC